MQFLSIRLEKHPSQASKSNNHGPSCEIIAEERQSLTDRYDAVVDEACMDLFGKHFKRPDENTDP